jgi:DNA-binding Lrp family transcriptional regulator
MPSAFVLFNVEGGSEDNVLKELRTVEAVKEAHVFYGVYDLIATIKTDTLDELKKVLTHKIRSIKQVRSTITLMMVEE